MTTPPTESMLEKNRAFYASAAAGYDVGRGAFYARERRRISRDLKRLLVQGQWSGKVVDIGCGTGFYSAQTAAAGATSIHCVDLNQTFLDAARANIADGWPGVQVSCQVADLETLLEAPGQLLTGPVLVVLGSVLQYVPDYLVQMRRLAEIAPQAMFVIASTPVNVRGNLFEETLARVDYLLHKIVHGKRHGGAQGELVTQPVDPQGLCELFAGMDFMVSCYRYRTFHTPLMHHLYAPLTRVFPRIASRFTLLAWSRQAESGSV